MFSMGGLLPELEKAIPAIEKAATVGEALMIVGPKLIADIVTVKSDPLALGTLLTDLEAAWPQIVDAARSGTVAASEPAAAA